jgi:hypothetical protein
MSIYYTFRFKDSSVVENLRATPAKEGEESFRWIGLKELKKEDLSLPIDQLVAGMIKV